MICWRLHLRSLCAAKRGRERDRPSPRADRNVSLSYFAANLATSLRIAARIYPGKKTWGPAHMDFRSRNFAGAIPQCSRLVR